MAGGSVSEGHGRDTGLEPRHFEEWGRIATDAWGAGAWESSATATVQIAPSAQPHQAAVATPPWSQPTLVTSVLSPFLTMKPTATASAGQREARYFFSLPQRRVCSQLSSLPSCTQDCLALAHQRPRPRRRRIRQGGPQRLRRSTQRSRGNSPHPPAASPLPLPLTQPHPFRHVASSSPSSNPVGSQAEPSSSPAPRGLAKPPSRSPSRRSLAPKSRSAPWSEVRCTAPR